VSQVTLQHVKAGSEDWCGTAGSDGAKIPSGEKRDWDGLFEPQSFALLSQLALTKPIFHLWWFRERFV